MNFSKASSIYILSSFFNKGIAFLFLPLLTSYLIPADYGVVTLFSNSILFLMPFVSMSIPTSVSTEYFKNDAKTFSEYFSTILLLPLSVVMLCILILIPFNRQISTYTGIESQYLFVLPILTLSVFFFEVLLVIIRSKDKPLHFAAFTLIKTIAEIGIAAFFIIKLGMHWQGRVLSWLIVGCFLIIYTVYYLNKNKFLTSRIDKKYIASELSFSISIIISQFAIFMITSSDKFFIAKYLNTAEVGIYGVASQIAFISYAFFTGINLSFQPFLYKTLSAGLESSKRIMMPMMLKIIGITFLMCVGIAILSPLLYHFFVDVKYSKGEAYVKWIVLANFFWFIQALLMSYVYYFKLKKAMLFQSLTITLASALFNFLFVEKYGVEGALAALISSTFITTLVFFTLLKYRYKIV